MAVYQIGRYRCHSIPLAQDCMGTLFEGRETDTGAAVYIKQLRAHDRHMSAADIVGIWQGVQHAALATARDAVELEQQYLVLPRPTGELLSKSFGRLREKDLWSRFQLLSIIIQVCKAVEALHSVGLAHGSISPANIVIGRDAQNEVTLLCFEPFAPRPTSHYLEAGEQMLYLAQEQLRGDGDMASDIYALGMLLYTGFSEHKPFAAGSPYALAEKVVWGNFAPFAPLLENLHPDVGQAIAPDLETLGAVATRAIRRKPGERYTTVEEMRKLLEHLAKRLSPIALGRMLYQDGEPEPAITVLQEAAANAEFAAEAYVLQGRIYGFHLNNYDESFKAFRRALKLDPTLDSAMLGLAELYMQHERYASAKAQYELLLPHHLNDASVLLSYANVLYHSGGAVAALNTLHRLQELFPYLLPAYVLAIQIYMQENRLNEAEAECKRVIESIVKVVGKGSLNRDEVAHIYFLRGLLHHEQERNEEAVRWLHHALEQRPAHHQSHALLAKLYAEMGAWDESLYHFLASRLDSDEADPASVLRALAAISGRDGDQDTAQ